MVNRTPPTSRHFEFGLNDGTFGLLALAFFLLGVVMWSALGPNVEKTDFSLTYVGAKLVHDGMAHDLYNIEQQQKLRDSLFRRPSPLFFEHPPFEALILSPLGGLSYTTAYRTWGILNAAILWCLVLFLRPHLPWPGEHLGYICLWVLFAPVIVSLYQGQSSLLVLASYSLAYLFLKIRKDALAGLALGIGLFRFQFVAPFALIFLFRRQWRVLLGLVASALFFALLSFLTVGWTGIATYIRFVLTIASNPQNESYGSAVDMPTIHGLVYAMLGRAMNHVGLNVIVVLLSLGLLGWVARRWRAAVGRSTDLMFATSVAASLVSGSHMFTHDFSPLVVAMFLAAANVSGASVTPRGSRYRFVIWIVLAILWAFPVYFLLVASHRMYLLCPVLLFFIYCVVQLAAELERHPGSDTVPVATGA